MLWSGCHGLLPSKSVRSSNLVPICPSSSTYRTPDPPKLLDGREDQQVVVMDRSGLPTIRSGCRIKSGRDALSNAHSETRSEHEGSFGHDFPNGGNIRLRCFLRCCAVHQPRGTTSTNFLRYDSRGDTVATQLQARHLDAGSAGLDRLAFGIDRLAI